MGTKQEIKDLILSVQKFGGEYTFKYVKLNDIYDTKKMNDIYYGGCKTVRICEYYTKLGFSDTITDKNIGIIVDDMYNVLKDNIFHLISVALENLELFDEELKYFDREDYKENYEDFKAEVIRLKELEVWEE